MQKLKIKNQDSKLEKIVALAKRRGFVFPGSEIYGGLAGFYDYGPLGVLLKNNIKQLWWKDMVSKRDDVFGLDAAIIMNPKSWEASGHIAGFSDFLIECPSCHKRFKKDEVKNKCPECEGDLSVLIHEGPRKFNLMFKTFVGSAEDTSAIVYLRPETAQGIFMNFKNVLNTMRVKIPFGIAQIGKAFRNEINPKDFIFRTREFEQMELEYFVCPGEDDDRFNEWIKNRVNWYKSIGLENIHLHEQPKKELAHYSKATTDIEYDFPFGRQEIEGIANRGDFDLRAHSLNYFDEESKKDFIPFVIEPSAGVDRIFLALLCEAYTEEKERTFLKFSPQIAPYKAAVFPLLANKPKLVELARKIYEDLKTEWVTAWDDRGNIGKRYYSQDEIGTPFCVTVDFDSLEDKSVTVRNRDSMEQKRIKIDELKEYFGGKLS